MTLVASRWALYHWEGLCCEKKDVLAIGTARRARRRRRRSPPARRARSCPAAAPARSRPAAPARNENVVKIWSCGGDARVRYPSQPSPGAATESRIGCALPPLAANRADAAAPHRQRKWHVKAIIKAPYDNGQSFYQLTAHNRGRRAPCPALRVSPIFFIRKAVVRRRYAILPIWVNSR